MRKFRVEATVTREAQSAIANGDFRKLSTTTSSEMDGATLYPSMIRLEIGLGFTALYDYRYFFESFPTIKVDELETAARNLDQEDLNRFIEEKLKQDPDVYETLRTYGIPGPMLTTW